MYVLCPLQWMYVYVPNNEFVVPDNEYTYVQAAGDGVGFQSSDMS